MTRPLVFLDTETTGLDPNRHQVWEIAYAVDDGPILTSVVHHDTPVLTGEVRAALRVNHYLDRFAPISIDSSTNFEEELRTALEGATIVGSNPTFDAGMLRARWDGHTPWHHRLWDISSYAAGVFGWDELHSLAGIAEYLGITKPDHTAEMDVHTLRECFRRLQHLAQR